MIWNTKEETWGKIFLYLVCDIRAKKIFWKQLQVVRTWERERERDKWGPREEKETTLKHRSNGRLAGGRRARRSRWHRGDRRERRSPCRRLVVKLQQQSAPLDRLTHDGAIDGPGWDFPFQVHVEDDRQLTRVEVQLWVDLVWERQSGQLKVMHLSQLQAPGCPPPPPKETTGDLTVSLCPGVGNLTTGWVTGVGHIDRRQSALWSPRVQGWGCLTILSVPGMGI